MAKKKKTKWMTIIIIISILFVISILVQGLFSKGTPSLGNTAVIPIYGVILTSTQNDLFSADALISSQVVSDIKRARDNPNIKAIVFEINSPGGAPVATDEIAYEILKTKKPTVAWIREIGASGGYWIASSTDYIVANRMSITGSIGVIGSYLDFSGLISDFNVSYERLIAGRYKDTGVPFRRLSQDERKLLQKKLDLLHEEFKKAVKKNRGLSNSEIELVGNGEFYLGMEALQLGLVDELGGEDQVIEYIENTLNISVKIVRYERKKSIADILLGLNKRSSFFASDNLAMFR